MHSSCNMLQDSNNMTDAEKKLALRQVIKQIDVHPGRVVVDLFGIKKRWHRRLTPVLPLFVVGDDGLEPSTHRKCVI